MTSEEKELFRLLIRGSGSVVCFCRFLTKFVRNVCNLNAVNAMHEEFRDNVI